MNQSLHCRNFLQTGAVARFINICLGVYPADSRKACCEVCNNSEQIIAKHVNFKACWEQKAPREGQRTFCVSQMWISQTFELQRPDLESLHRLRLCSLCLSLSTAPLRINTCGHLKEIVENCLSYKKEVR